MDQTDRERLAKLIRDGRVTKGITQQELSDLAGLSLRSIQRIEKAEVAPRAYTLRILFEKLAIAEPIPATATESNPASPAQLADTSPASIRQPDSTRNLTTPTDLNPASQTRPAPKFNFARKLILTIATGLLILLAIAAFIAQSARFPETDFERFLLAMGAIALYTAILFRIWK